MKKIVTAIVMLAAVAACTTPADDTPTLDPSLNQSVGGGGGAGGGGGGGGGGSDLTPSQEQAIGSAQDYLALQGFSKAGLIKQLSSTYGEGFSKADATFAVNHLDVDWNAEAVEAAKAYLALSHFSRTGLIQQLSSSFGDGFTQAQATYAADQVGLG